MVVSSDFHPAQAREEAFSLIGAGDAVRIADSVVDPVRIELCVQIIPVRGFIGVNGRHVVNAGRNHFTALGFALGNHGEAFAAAFTPDNNNLALAVLVDR